MSGQPLATLDDLVRRARGDQPIRLAVVNAAQGAVLETLREAARLGIAEPVLIGGRADIAEVAATLGWEIDPGAVIETGSEADAARAGVELVRTGRADALMKGISIPTPSCAPCSTASTACGSPGGASATSSWWTCPTARACWLSPTRR